MSDSLTEKVGLHYLPWMQDAECGYSDPEHWFPDLEHDGPWSIAQMRARAKKICGTCEVQQQCYDYAVANDERYGIWGGVEFDPIRRKQE